MRLSHRSFSFGAALLISACSAPPATLGDGGVQLPDTFSRPDAARPDSGQALGVVTVVVRDEVGALVGADVVIDDANGVREVGITGAGGRVMIPNVAWGTGRITITASAGRHPMQSLGGFRRADLGSRIDGTGAITIDLVSYYDAFAVSGNITNSADPTRPVRLFADVAGRLTVTGTTFSGEVQRNRPFHVWALDSVFTSLSGYHYTNTQIALVRVDHTPLTGTATFDVDMSTALPLTTISGSLPVPADGNPAQSGYPGIVVTTDESRASARVGLTSEIALTADGTSFDFTVSQLGTVDTGSPVTVYYIETLAHLYSQMRLDGVATSHAITSGSQWPAPPMLVSPAAGATVTLQEPIELSGVDATMPVRLYLSDDYGALWYLDLPAGATTATFPVLPEGTDTTYWMNMHVQVDACEPWPGHRIACRREAGGDTFAVTL